MRFLCIYSSVRNPSHLEKPEIHDALAKLIGEMTVAGALLATERCASSDDGARLRLDNGELVVRDGPSIGPSGLRTAAVLLLQAPSKAEAIDWCKRVLTVTGEGEIEVLQLNAVGSR